MKNHKTLLFFTITVLLVIFTVVQAAPRSKVPGNNPHSLNARISLLEDQLKILLPCPPRAPARFVDNGDGTICDHETGLMWEKKNSEDNMQNPRNLHDADNRYTWTDNADGNNANPDGTVFTVFLAGLNGVPIGAVPFAGYSDWRLPTYSELPTLLLDPCPLPPPIGGCLIDPLFIPTENFFYWTSTTLSDVYGSSFPLHDTIAFTVIFGSSGGVSDAFGTKPNPNPVRAVRGIPRGLALVPPTIN